VVQVLVVSFRSLYKVMIEVTYLVKQVRAAFWKSAEVQTQVVSVLIKSAFRTRSAILTHMLEQPAELAAWVTHCKTQAEMLGVLNSQQSPSGRTVRSMKNSLSVDSSKRRNSDDGCKSELHFECDGVGGGTELLI
jgi:hypothetical protein